MQTLVLTAALAFPEIDPVLVEIGPVAVRWYSLAYILGLVLGWAWMIRLVRVPAPICRRIDVDDFVLWAMVAVVIGGRLGYVLFYNFAYYAANPGDAFRLWDGGMSFHGGLTGMVVAIIWYCRRRKIPLFAFSDRIACVAPIGLLLGRLANFINGELYGRVSDVPWAMVFPGGGPEPRHPSQLYEAALEGALLLILLNVLFFATRLRDRPGIITGLFVIGYATARIIAEFFREPDVHLGFIAGGVTMGQILSVPMAAAGAFLIWLALRTTAKK